MTRFSFYLAIGLLTLGTALHATTFTFTADPFAGTNADPNDGIRQIIPTPQFDINFDIQNDVFAFDPTVFGISQIVFANDVSTNLPPTGINVVVLQNGPPLAAGSAHAAIADQKTDSNSGFFVYFNSTLMLPRLVFARDLGDPTSDIAIMARMSNLQNNFAAMPTFTQANFVLMPEPSTGVMISAGLLACVLAARRQSKKS
jgi:hypothetical protein